MPVVIALAFVLSAGGSSATVLASCGDYLHHAGNNLDSRFDSSGTTEADVIHPLFAGDDRMSGRNLPVKPCSGPECRRGPVVPAQPLPVEVRPSGTERLVLFVSSDPAHCGNARHPRAGDLFIELEDHRAGLDRPPRPA
jgi:hypothetical protein